MRLIRRTEIPKPDVVYNLHVEKNHNYVANGMVVSNCHGSKATKLQTLLTDYGANITHRFGLTGTLPKEEVDKMNVHISLGEVIGEYTTKSLIDKEWLARPNIHIIQLDDVGYLRANNVNTVAMMWEEEDHFYKTNVVRMQVVANLLMKQRDSDARGNTLVLVNAIKYGKELSKLIPNSYFLNGSDHVKMRKQVYDLFETNNDLIVICTKQIAGVGLSIDRIFNLAYIDAGKSFITTMQQIGRGLRKSSDKDEIYVMDICSNLATSLKRIKQRVSYYKEANYPFQKSTTRYEDVDAIS
jgi:superfamily II DNA or RNA helicase